MTIDEDRRPLTSSGAGGPVSTAQPEHTVGGIRHSQPFKIRRLGHTGFDLRRFEESIDFYTNLLGFSVSDTFDFGTRATDPEVRASLGNSTGYFLRYGSDHHALAMFPHAAMHAIFPARKQRPGTVNQITWQVSSLEEVLAAEKYLRERGVRIMRTGRDMPGSNWHVYVSDPDGHSIELYYGMEQIGWSGQSKPGSMTDMIDRREAPSLPVMSERDELEVASARGDDLTAGCRWVDDGDARFDVGGVLLPRPFRITRLGPMSVYVNDVDASTAFYCDLLGFQLTETVEWQGHRCTFLRCGAEHHSLALFPIAAREQLGSSPDTTNATLGLQVASYCQLRAAAQFLHERGATLRPFPKELHPGIDVAFHVVDPDGDVLCLYLSMEHLDWQGNRPPAAPARVGDDALNWPETIEGRPYDFTGDCFLGPWG